MKSSAQQVLPGLVDDFPVGEVGLPLPFREGLRIPPQLQVQPEFRGPAREERHRERVAFLRQEDVGIFRPYNLLDSPKNRLLVPVDLVIVHLRAEEPIRHARDAQRSVHAKVQERPLQRRQRIVEGEVLLLRAPCAVRVAHEAHGEDPVLHRVPLAEPHVDVEEAVVHVAAVGVEDVSHALQVAVVAGHDLQDGLRLVILQGNTVGDLAYLLHPIEDLDASLDRGQIARRCMQEERRHESRVLDAMGAALVPEPKDHRVLVVVRVGVDDPAVQESPPVPPSGPAGHIRRCGGEVGESAREEDLVGREHHPHLDPKPTEAVPSSQLATRDSPEPQGGEETHGGLVVPGDGRERPRSPPALELSKALGDQGPRGPPPSLGRVGRDEIHVADGGRPREEAPLEESSEAAVVLRREEERRAPQSAQREERVDRVEGGSRDALQGREVSG